MTEQAPYLEKYFRLGEEILTFEGRDELVGTVKALLADSDRRNTIARRGFERVSRDHTYDRRFHELLGGLSQQVAQRPHQAIDWPEFETVARRHRFGPSLKLLRAAIVVCASLLWRKQRGARAARRIVFELSWRLVGLRTYTAAGWPGRMFYKES